MKRMLSLILTSCMLFSVTSCAGDNSDNQNNTESPDTQSSVSDTAPAEETTVDPFNLLEKQDLGGLNLKYITRPFEAGAWTDIYVEEITGEPFNDAIWDRNLRVSEKYNVTFEHLQGDAGTLTTSILAQEDEFSFVNIAYTDHLSLANSGYLTDLNTLSPLNLSESWWDQACNRDMSVCGKLFMTMGDINTMDDRYTWCYYFNKNLIEDLQLENPYDLVKNGTWTFDKFYQMAEAAADDVNGDSVMTEKDKWGFISEQYGYYLTVLGSGSRCIEKDNQDQPYLAVSSDRMLSSLEKVYKIFGDKSVSFLAEDWTKIASGNVWLEYVFPMFMNGQGLFFMGALDNSITMFRDMEYDYGLIPSPKLDESQSGYYCSISPYGVTAISIPASHKDADTTALVLEAMAQASVTTVTPAYYDVVLVNKGLRDQESLEMLQLIMASKVFDLGYLNNWGGTGTLIGSLYGNSDYVSTIAKYEKAINKALDDMISKYTSY